MIKFNLYNVTNKTNGTKARIHYSLDNMVDGRKAVTLYGKDYTRDLHSVFEEAKNESDSMTDYFENSKVVFFEGHALYAQARKAAERALAK